MSLADLAVGATTFRGWPMSARVAGFGLHGGCKHALYRYYSPAMSLALF